MTEDRDYLWDQRGPADDFVVELERRLAPLDDAEALLDELDLDGLDGDVPDGGEPEDDDSDDDAVVLVLHQASADEPAPRRTDAAPRRGSLWLAAAVAVFGLSVGVLATESQSRRDAQSQLEIGAGTRDGHVILTAPSPSVHAQLRPAHAGLSDCALGLAPGASVALSVDLGGGTVELSDDSLDDDLRSCLVATFAALELDEPTTIDLELNGPIRIP